MKNTLRSMSIQLYKNTYMRDIEAPFNNLSIDKIDLIAHRINLLGIRL